MQIKFALLQFLKIAHIKHLLRPQLCFLELQFLLLSTNLHFMLSWLLEWYLIWLLWLRGIIHWTLILRKLTYIECRCVMFVWLKT